MAVRIVGKSKLNPKLSGRKALIVGIDAYSSGITTLKNCVSDAEAVAKLLQEYGDFAVNLLLNESATLEEFKNALIDIFNPNPKSRESSKTIFFYYCGASTVRSEVSDGYLPATDSNTEEFDTTAISMQWLYQLIQESPIKQKIVCIDGCHAGAFIEIFKANHSNQKKSEDYCFIAASQASELAYDSSKENSDHGAFTNILLKALDPHLQQDGLVTSRTLVDAIPDEIVKGQHPVHICSGNSIVLTFTPEARTAAETMVKAASSDFLAQSPLNDLAEGQDLLHIESEVCALAEVLLMRDLEPPVAVGILGGWGSGKSHIMHLMQKRMTEIRSQPINEKKAWGGLAELSKGNNEIQLSPYVGHIYQIKFDAWTYARSNLWASLMETIFFELNRQLTLEKQLEKVGIDSLKGGKIWQALNDMSDEERQILLECELDRKKLEDWEKIVDQQQIEDLLLENLKKTNQKQIELLSSKESALRGEKERLQQETERIKLEVVTELRDCKLDCVKGQNQIQ